MPRGKHRGDEEESGFGRVSLSDVFKRRGFWGGVAFLLVFAPLASLVYFLPDIYRSAATVLIERQQIPDDLVKTTVTSALEVRLQTISQEILSRPSLEKVIAAHKLYEDMLDAKTPMEQVIERMRQDVKIELTGGDRRGDRATVAFIISYRGRDARKVAQVAGVLASSYINENLTMRSRQAEGTADFLRGQLLSLANKLKEQELKVSQFKQKHIGELPEQLDANLQTLQQLTTQLQLNGENMARAAERRSNLEQELSAVLGTTTPAGPDAGAVRLAQLRNQLAGLQTRLSDRHPDVQRLKTEITNLEDALAGRGTNGGVAAAGYGLTPQVQQLKSALSDIEVQIKGLEVEAANLKRQLGTYQIRVESLPRVQQEYQSLAREYETTQEMYKSLTLRQSESALAESLEQRGKGEQFRVIEPALPSETPAAPKRPRLFALVLLLALAAAAAAIFGPEALDSSVHTIEQLQARCELPILVSIPRIVGPADIARKRRRLLLGLTGLTLALGGLVVGAYLLARENWALTSLLVK